MLAMDSTLMLDLFVVTFACFGMGAVGCAGHGALANALRASSDMELRWLALSPRWHSASPGSPAGAWS